MKTNLIQTTRKSNRSIGFTLVELLVVIAIVAVLAAVTFSLTGKIKDKAYQANAMSSIRQVAAFNIAYSTENNGDINTLRWAEDKLEAKPSWIKNTFWGRLQPYIFNDPTTNDARLQKDMKLRLDQLFSTDTTKDKNMPNTDVRGAQIFRGKSGLVDPFAFNSALATWEKFAKTTTFSDPSQVIYFAYGYGMFDAADGKSYAPMALKGQPIKLSNPSNSRPLSKSANSYNQRLRVRSG